MKFVVLLIEDSIHMHGCQTNQISLSKIIFIFKKIEKFWSNPAFGFVMWKAFQKQKISTQTAVSKTEIWHF